MSIQSTRWLACLLALATSQVVAADRPWRMVITPQYRLLSQLSDGETNGWMRNFDQFILSTSDVLQIDVKALPPLTVVIFDRDKDYTPYKLRRPDGQIADVSGQFVRRPTWGMIGMAHDKDSAELRHTLQHEATHWLMSADQARQPAWFAEGIAEMLATFERHGGKVDWARPIMSRLQLLRDSGTIPLAQFLTEPSAIFDRDDRTDRFYAQSWLFTHFLMLSKDSSRRQLLFKFLQTFRTESGEATVNAVFGPALKEVEHDFTLYVGQATYTYMILPVKPAPEPPPPQPAPPALVEASLGFLALGAGIDDLARTHAEKAIALDPKDPDGHAVLAYLALQNGDFNRAAVHAEDALERGSRDSELYMLLGDSYMRGENARKPDAAQRRVSMYENAVNLSPRRLDIYDRLTEALFTIDTPREEDGKFLALGLRVFPGEDWLRVGAAAVAYRLGHREAAMSSIDTALRTDSTLDGMQRDYAAGLRGHWSLDAMRSEIDAAVEKNDFTAARAIVSRYRERIGENSDLTSFLDQVDSGLELRELMSKYQMALRANKKAEARSVAAQLLARPSLPADLRRYLQQSSRGGK
ncbi:MAG: hypothetical protein WDO56_10225 [Gammaproteobacteria bacterium]